MAGRRDGAGRGVADRAAQPGQVAHALRRPRAVVGGPSGPMLLFQIAAIRAKSIGPEGPPTTALSSRPRAQPRGGSNISALGLNGRGA
ncbi:DUF6053 domain-containing protein [Lysobacter enzymogenes]|uniref:DUF6053 domain-containing protein n=1 Tax=Lysobacter enzymogenes TaxID=69 RepID=UPI003749A2DB